MLDGIHISFFQCPIRADRFWLLTRPKRVFNRRNNKLFRGLKTTENTVRIQKMPFVDGHCLYHSKPGPYPDEASRKASTLRFSPLPRIRGIWYIVRRASYQLHQSSPMLRRDKATRSKHASYSTSEGTLGLVRNFLFSANQPNVRLRVAL
jgi:hypothetical protein